ncbi:hypothetical protein B0H13DRAFT_1875634 [Mycena leptocephala]|nr:hypothetical protein B0H13DRAFT_1875634 [Mycena leptocephala]
MDGKVKALSRQLQGEQLKKTNYWKYLKRARKKERRSGPIAASVQLKERGLECFEEYHPRNYTEFDVDLAILMYELGGGAALHALNKAPHHAPIPSHHLRENIETLLKDAKVGDHGPHANSRLKTFKMGSDLTATEDVVNAVRAGEIHVGKEFSVAAFSRHADTDYGAKPVLIMPTCKKGWWQSSAEILQKPIQAWKLSPYGEAKHGPRQEIASDGDGRRRAALYLICMHRRLGPDIPIYQFLCELERSGLNLYCGEDVLTMDFDYKHLFKRLCTLLCSKEGMLVNGVVVNKALLAHWLEKLSGQDWSDESIHALLNPKDAQDVPRAVKLLCLIADLQHLDTSGFTPSEKHTHRAISLLGEMFDALVEPFINPTLSLSEQITQLAKFAHIACALFLKHEAHTKALNPQLKVFLCLLGDGVLEKLFGRSRMIGGHSPNMAVDELRQRFCSALRMDKIFRKYPYLERKAKRLKLIHATLSCWTSAVASARVILAKYGCDVDVTALFGQEDFNLMRPKGGKHYPGASKEVDRSMANYTDGLVSDDSSDPANILRFNAREALDAETRAAQTVEARSVWINLGDDTDKLAHKKSILRTFMDPTFDINDAKSHDRSMRIRYYSIGGDKWDRTVSTIYSRSTANNHLLKIQGLFATLIAFDTSKVSLAILQCTGIKVFNTNPVTYYPGSLVPFMNSEDQISWAWVAEFVAFDSIKAKQATDTAARLRQLNLTCDGRLVLPLVSADLKQTTLEDRLKMPPSMDSNAEKTWVFSDAQLDDMGSTLLSKVQDEDVRLKIPVYGPVKQGRSVTAPAAKDGRRPCRICKNSIAGLDRQNRMGKHILLSSRGVEEANNAEQACTLLPVLARTQATSQVAKKYPCGFCGKAIVDGACTIGITSGKATSSCPAAYQFQIAAASKSSVTKSCTNVPIRCSLCTETRWKYSMVDHLEDRHPTWEMTMPDQSRQLLSSKITTTHDEECRLGIPETARTTEQVAVESAATGQRRGPPRSLPGTPQRSRVLVTLPHRATTVARRQDDAGSSSIDDVFT